MCIEGASETKAKGEWTNIVLLLVCQQVSEFFLEWTQTRCAPSVFFRDAKFLLEAVGITKKKKERKTTGCFFLILPE